MGERESNASTSVDNRSEFRFLPFLLLSHRDNALLFISSQTDSFIITNICNVLRN